MDCDGACVWFAPGNALLFCGPTQTSQLLYRPQSAEHARLGTSLTRGCDTLAPTTCHVQFYSDWCPYCQDFQPKFDQLATKVSEWPEERRAHAHVGALSCAVHDAFCIHEMGVTSVPTFRFFPSTPGEHNTTDKGETFDALPTVSGLLDRFEYLCARNDEVRVTAPTSPAEALLPAVRACRLWLRASRTPNATHTHKRSAVVAEQT